MNYKSFFLIFSHSRLLRNSKVQKLKGSKTGSATKGTGHSQVSRDALQRILKNLHSYSEKEKITVAIVP
jgi:hypothetical protein